MSVVVLAPVLRRPERVEPLVRSYEESTAATADYGGIFFLCSPGDREERDAVIAAGHRPIVVRWEPGQGDYARKVNFGYRRALALGVEWALLGADDLAFHPGWFEAALAVHEQTGACVVGTNDLGNPTVMAGRHSTHSLVHRDYLDCGTIDEDGKILHEGYHHNWVDTEFVETARSRGTFAFARDSRIEHLHPLWRKGQNDEVYELGQRHYADDAALFQQRRGLWG